LRKLAFKIIHTTTKLLPAWYNVLNKCKLSQCIMPHDIATCWNSTFDMLTFALEYCEAIDIICANKNMEIRNYELSEKEWELAQQLCDILKDATLFFSQSMPNLATVIPAMDMIDRKLTTDSITCTYELAIRASLGLANKTLNHYYSMTDWSEVYQIAMGESFSILLTMTLPVLHPQHKLSYFK
ncbi:hypothetical protein BDR06DRAFT_838264, partial [Suillus hirtellus]